MSFICCICHDLLTEQAQIGESVLALRCGHMYHSACIDEWFRSDENSSLGEGRGKCPFCNEISSLSNSLRIFSTGDARSNDIEEQIKTQKTLTKKIKRLQAELEKAKEDLDVFQEANQILHSESTEAKDERSIFEEENQMIQSDLQEAKEELGVFKDEIDIYRSELNQAKSELEAVRSELREVKEERDELKFLYGDECVAHEKFKIEHERLLAAMFDGCSVNS